METTQITLRDMILATKKAKSLNKNIGVRVDGGIYTIVNCTYKKNGTSVLQTLAGPFKAADAVQFLNEYRGA